MTRSTIARLVALAAGLSASLAGPALALAHGHAHSEALEHAVHHGPGAQSNSHPSVAPNDHDEDHAHPRLDPSAFTRLVKDVPAVHSDAVTITLAHVVVRDTCGAPEPNETPPDRSGLSPPQSRAPPAL